jgi:translation initiation factor 2 alpha subunit (eIF-2alpha)/uncharacterized protein YwbE
MGQTVVEGVEARSTSRARRRTSLSCEFAIMANSAGSLIGSALVGTNIACLAGSMTGHSSKGVGASRTRRALRVIRVLQIRSIRAQMAACTIRSRTGTFRTVVASAAVSMSCESSCRAYFAIEMRRDSSYVSSNSASNTSAGTGCSDVSTVSARRARGRSNVIGVRTARAGRASPALRASCVETGVARLAAPRAEDVRGEARIARVALGLACNVGIATLRAGSALSGASRSSIFALLARAALHASAIRRHEFAFVACSAYAESACAGICSFVAVRAGRSTSSASELTSATQETGCVLRGGIRVLSSRARSASRVGRVHKPEAVLARRTARTVGIGELSRRTIRAIARSRRCISSVRTLRAVSVLRSDSDYGHCDVSARTVDTDARGCLGVLSIRAFHALGRVSTILELTGRARQASGPMCGARVVARRARRAEDRTSVVCSSTREAFLADAEASTIREVAFVAVRATGKTSAGSVFALLARAALHASAIRRHEFAFVACSAYAESACAGICSFVAVRAGRSTSSASELTSATQETGCVLRGGIRVLSSRARSASRVGRVHKPEAVLARRTARTVGIGELSRRTIRAIARSRRCISSVRTLRAVSVLRSDSDYGHCDVSARTVDTDARGCLGVLSIRAFHALGRVSTILELTGRARQASGPMCGARVVARRARRAEDRTSVVCSSTREAFLADAEASTIREVAFVAVRATGKTSAGSVFALLARAALHASAIRRHEFAFVACSAYAESACAGICSFVAVRAGRSTSSASELTSATQETGCVLRGGIRVLSSRARSASRVGRVHKPEAVLARRTARTVGIGELSFSAAVAMVRSGRCECSIFASRTECLGCRRIRKASSSASIATRLSSDACELAAVAILTVRRSCSVLIFANRAGLAGSGLLTSRECARCTPVALRLTLSTSTATRSARLTEVRSRVIRECTNPA